MTVTVKYPAEILVRERAASGPVEAADAIRRVSGRLDRAGFQPLVAFGVSIGKRNGTAFTMKNRKRIHPARWACV